MYVYGRTCLQDIYTQETDREKEGKIAHRELWTVRETWQLSKLATSPST